MGLGQETEKKIFLSIVNGSLAKRVEQGSEKAVEREIEYPKGTKKMIYERLYPDVTAVIEGVEIKESPFGEQLCIHLVDVLDKFTLTMSVKGREAKAFMQCFPNLNIKQQVTLNPYNYTSKKDNKKKIGLGIKQNGEDIKFFYNESNGMPQTGEERLDKDEFELAMSQQTIFLKKATKKLIEKYWGQKTGGAPEAETVTHGLPPSDTLDGMPF
jgi:hypothetical protein